MKIVDKPYEVSETPRYSSTCEVPAGMVFQVRRVSPRSEVWSSPGQCKDEAGNSRDVCSGTFIKGLGERFVRLDDLHAGYGSVYIGNITFPASRVTFYPDAQLVLGPGVK